MGDAWDGRPLHPERDGWHWLGEAANPVALFWKSAPGLEGGGTWFSGTRGVSVWAYLGPCLLPADAQAALDAVREAARVEGGEIVKARFISETRKHMEELLAQARREGMECAMEIARQIEDKPGIRTAGDAAAAIRAAMEKEAGG